MKLEQSYPIVENCYLNGEFNQLYMYFRTTGLFPVFAELYETTGRSLKDLKSDIIATNQKLDGISEIYHNNRHRGRDELKNLVNEPLFSHLSEKLHDLRSFRVFSDFLYMHEASDRWFISNNFFDIIITDLLKHSYWFFVKTRNIADAELSGFDFIPNFLIWNYILKEYKQLALDLPEMEPASGTFPDIEKRFFTQVTQLSKLFCMDPIAVGDSRQIINKMGFINTELTWSETQEADIGAIGDSWFWSELHDIFVDLQYLRNHILHQDYDQILKDIFDYFPITLIGFPVEKPIDISVINASKISQNLSLAEIA